MGNACSDCRKTIFYAEFIGLNVRALIERPLKIGKMIGIFIVFSDFTKHIGEQLSLHFGRSMIAPTRAWKIIGFYDTLSRHCHCNACFFQIPGERGWVWRFFITRQ